MSRELAAQSLAAADALGERLALIVRIRADASIAHATHVARATSTRDRIPVTTEPAAAQLIFPEPVPAASDGTSAPRPSRAAFLHSSPVQPYATGPTGVSSVQVVLVVVGVSLLSAGAVAFLVHAFLDYGIVWRSLIVGAVTVATFASATVLVRRGLRATAEGLSLFAVVLTYLDAWAARTNNLFGWADAEASTFWGVTVVVLSVVFIVWSRSTVGSGATRDESDAEGRAGRWLRSPHFAGWVMLPGGAALIAAGITRDVASLPVFSALLSVLATSLLHPLVPVRRRGRIVAPATGERVTMLVAALAATIPALIAGLFVGNEIGMVFSADPIDARPSLLATGLVAMTVTAQVVIAERSRSIPAPALVVGAFMLAAGPFLLSSAIAAIFATHEPIAVLSILAIGATAMAWWCVGAARPQAILLQPVAARRDTLLLLRRPMSLRAAALSTAIIAAIALIAPLSTTVFQLSMTLQQTLSSIFALAPAENVFGVSADLLWAVGAIAGTVAVSIVMWRTGSRSLERPGLIWGCMIAAILTVSLLTSPIAITIGLISIASANLLLLTRLRRRNSGGDPRPAGVFLALAVPGATALLLGWLMSYGAVVVWGPASALVVAIIFSARMATSNVTARATLLATACVGLMVNVLAVPRAVWMGAQLVSIVSASQLVAVVGVLLIGAGVVSVGLRGVSSTDRVVVFWVGLGAAAVALLAERTGAFGATRQASAFPLIDQVLIDLVIAVGLVGALLATCLHVSTRLWRVERGSASFLLAPAVCLVAFFIASPASVSSTVPSIVPATAALITAIGSVIGAIRVRAERTRPFREVGIGIVTVAALVGSTSERATTSWLPVLLVAFTLLLLATSHDGLVASAARRRHLGWAALALATTSLWMRLSVSDGIGVESFVLPLAGALLLVAAAISRSGARVRSTTRESGTGGSGTGGSGTGGSGAMGSGTRETTPHWLALPTSLSPAHQAAPSVALLGLLIAIVPISVTAVSGVPLRAVVIGAVSAALLLFAAFARAHQRSVSALLGVTAFAGALGVLITGAGRAAAMLNGSRQGLEFDGWLAFVLVIFLVAGFGFARAEAFSHPPLQDLPRPTTALRSSPEAVADRPRDIRMFASAVTAIVAVIAVAVLESSSVGTGIALPRRAELTILAFSSLHVIAWVIDIRPLTRTVAWVAMGGAVLVAVASTLAGSFDPIEASTTPIAVALIASGSQRLAEDAHSRSWLSLGPGVGMLLVPSLIATLVDRPIWRLLSIGFIGVAIIVIGLTRRLQAPFVISSAVVTCHAIATFSPQIRAVYESVDWWIWLIPGGIIVIVLAARLERRITDVKEIALSIRSLR